MSDELKELWKPDEPRRASEAEKEAIMKRAQEKLEKFERRLRFRELQEILPSIVVSAVFGAQFVHAQTVMIKLGSAMVVCACLWGAFYLLTRGRGPADPDRGLPLAEFRAGVAAKYDHQIWLLSRVKYWYVAPLFAGILTSTLGRVEARGWKFVTKDWAVLALMVVFAAFVVWLNESWAVRRLKKERDEVRAGLGN